MFFNNRASSYLKSLYKIYKESKVSPKPTPQHLNYLKQQGYAQKTIATIYGVSERTVRNWKKNEKFIPDGEKDDWEYFKAEPLIYQGKSYKLVWCWQKKGSFLRIRTCHRTKKKYEKN